MPLFRRRVSRRGLRCVARAFAIWFLVTVAVSYAVRASGFTVNKTPSLPRGLYRQVPLRYPLSRGDIVAIEMPPLFERYYAEGSIQRGDVLIKQIVALPGDHVCTEGGEYVAAGQILGPVRETDAHGQSLPRHAVCGTVGAGLIYLGTPYPASIDSRYFGPVREQQLLTRLVPTWTF